MSSMRDAYFDIVKAIAMYMVVVWHVIEKGGGGGSIADFILGANMPIFFIVSGCFSYSTVSEFKCERLVRHLKSYFCPFVVISVVFSVLAACFGMIELSQVPLYALKRFLFAGWFIWALAIVYCLSFLGYNIPRLWHGAGSCLCVMSVYMLTFAIPTGVWWIGNVRNMMPHFLIGMFLLRKYEIYKKHWMGATAMTCYLGFLCLEQIVSPARITFYGLETCVFHFLDEPLDILLFLYVIAKGLLGSIGIMWAVYLCWKHFAIIARFGTETLGIYLLHQWILDRVSDAKLIPTRIFYVVLLALALFLSCHYLVVASKKLSFVRKYIWGSR